MSDHEWLSDGDEIIDSDDLQRRAEELESILNITPDEEGLIVCPVLPLRDAIVFPHMVSPLPVGRSSTLTALAEAQANHQIMLAIPQRDPRRQKLRVQDFLPIGVAVAVSELLNAPDEGDIVLVQGRHRVEIVDFVTDGPVLYARGRVIADPERPDPGQDAQMRHLMRTMERYLALSDSMPNEAMQYLLNINEPGWLADMIASSFPVRLQDRQVLLTTLDVTKRLELVTEFLSRELGILEIEEELDGKMQADVDRGQRETYLRERLRVIQRELGDGDPWTRDLEELHTRIKNVDLPEEATTVALKELERLYQMPPMSPEVGVIRTYLDWIIELPWKEATEDNLEIKHAAEVLEANHYGLDKAKDRILEYIAVKSLKPETSRQPILCFIGPPGTGKTTLGRSIAEALGRKFVRLSLGGVRDEAEMRGHRRTYIGALPGRIIQTMKRGATTNPVFILDEIDKLGVGYRGDPAAALLEVLDPEQHEAFSDHYLEIAYDLSNVMFITTANSRDEIPWALLDRMEVVDFPGYIEEEKLGIAKRFLVARQIQHAGLEEGEIQFSEQAIKRIIREYTYEAGVRNLEREIGRVCRKLARLKAEKKDYPTQVNAPAIVKYLGPPQFIETDAEREDQIGVATAIAWTAGGGEIMPIEVALMEGKGNMQITGSIGEVMQESAQAAMSYLKARAELLNINPEKFEELDVHIHIPEGGVPKDGPSAGITLATAVISAFTGRKVHHEIGMTGELTLRGRVLPVGGVRNKILAAHRAGLKTIILPFKNEKDLVDVPKRVKADLKIIPVKHMDDVLDLALLPAEKPKPKRKAVSKKPPKADDKSGAVQPGIGD